MGERQIGTGGLVLNEDLIFEKSSPEIHRKMLKFLGFTEREIRELVSRL